MNPPKSAVHCSRGSTIWHDMASAISPHATMSAKLKKIIFDFYFF